MKNSIFNLMIAGVLISVPLYPIGTVTCHKTLSIWMRQNFTYQAEEKGKDYWKNPTQTRIDKGGDCEDFAFYNQAVLKELGYKELKVIHIIGNKDYSHAICIFKHNGKWKYLDNQVFIPYKHFSDINDLVENACSKWKWWREIELPHKYKGKYHLKRIKE